MLFNVTLGIVILLSPPPPHNASVADTKNVAPPAEVTQDVAPSGQLEGLWPSEKLMSLMLTRWADEISRQHELDDEQRTKVREAVTKRWSTFLNENRRTIQPLVNEFIEMRMGLEPPKKEQVQAWAGKATPAFEQVCEQVDQGTAEFREILNPLQRAKFEREALKIGVGLQIARQKLKQWEAGEYEVGEVWQPKASERRQRRAERQRRSSEQETKTTPAAPKTEETDQIALELGAWEEYVEEFVGVYQLDEGQRTATLSVLAELKERAIGHRDRRRDEIAKLEHHIETFTGSEEELGELKKQLTELYGPIDEMFQELKRRIEQIPTARQRETVADNGE